MAATRLPHDNVPHYPTYLEKDDFTVAELLKQAGYRRGGVGKWSLGDAGTAGSAMSQGFSHWIGYLNQGHAHYYYTEYLDHDSGRLELPDNPTLRHTYSHDVLTEPALKFLQDSKNTPFFLYAAYTLPHFSSEDEDPDGLAVPSTDPRARCSTGQVASGRTRLSLLGLWSLSSTLRPGGAARRLERHPSGKEQRCDRALRFRNRYRRVAATWPTTTPT